MIPELIEGHTHVLGKPKNWDEEKHGSCGVLAVRHENGAFISAWSPSPEEIELLVSGRPVYIRIVGGQPAMAVWVE